MSRMPAVVSPPSPHVPMATLSLVPPVMAPAASDTEAAISRRLILSLVGLGVAMLCLLMHMADLKIALRSPATAGYAILFTGLAVIRWICRNPTTQARRLTGDVAEYFGLFMVISLVGAVASYPVAALSHGFSDAMLQRADLALHFNWLAWYEVVAAHPMLQDVSRSVYAMIYVSPAMLLGWLAWTDQRREAYAFIVAVWFAAWITLAAFRFMPAVGPFAYLWHGPFPYLPVSDLWQPQLIPQLRAHTIQVVDLGHLVGLVSAPSFHAAAAVLLIVFSARQGRIGIPLICVNLAMLLATPVEGTHYLTDLILGAIVALLSLQIVALLQPGKGAMPLPAAA